MGVVPRTKIGWALITVAAGGLAWALRRLLADGLRRLLVAPEDDEPITPEDVAAVRAAEERIRRGEYVSEEQVLSELRAQP